MSNTRFPGGLYTRKTDTDSGSCMANDLMAARYATPFPPAKPQPIPSGRETDLQPC